MKLIVLGSGTCVPSLQRNAPGYYLEAEGCQVLVDCGSGTLLQLEKAGRSYKEIDAVFITHGHPDHFADLMPFIQALIATPGFRREKSLDIICPGEFAEYYEKAIDPVLGRYLNFTVRTRAVGGRLNVGPFSVAVSKTIHSADSIAYRLEQGGKSIVFTGDADYDQGLVSLSRGADVLAADCSFPDSMKMKGHLSAGECGLVAQKAGVKQLVLSHIYPCGVPDIDRIKESREQFSGAIVLAEDLMEIDI